MSNAMVFGQTAPPIRYASADRDTGLGCCSPSSITKEVMKTKVYPTSGAPFLQEDLGGLQSTMVYVDSQASDAATKSDAQTGRVNALIAATQEDLSKSLKYHTLVHKLNAGVISNVH
eukprot:278340-Prymnesium_polylepis.1